MALALNDRVKETTTVTGTGTATLLGATTGFQSFAVVGNANTTYYCIADQGGANWEVGIGTYTASGTTLARTTVLSSSNAGSLVAFTAGIKDVFVTYPSSKGLWKDASGNAIGLGTPAAFVGTNITGTASGLTAGNVTTNANLTGAITSTGNATSLGSFTSLQLATALTNETGTGSAVFSDNASLLNPTYTGTLTGGTGILNIGSGQVYKDAAGNVAIGNPVAYDKLDVFGGTTIRGNLLVTKAASITVQVNSTAGGYQDISNSNGTSAISLSTNASITELRTTSNSPQVFYTNNIERMRIDSSGNVGIGASSPATKLHLLTPSAANVELRIANSLSYSSLLIDSAGDSRLYTPALNQIFSVNSTERMRINSSGIVTMSAYGAGAATFSAAGVISSVSDETWKIKDGAPNNPDEMLQKLKPGYWFYNEEKALIFGAERQLGFYAQNVNAAIGPEAAPAPETYVETDINDVESIKTKPWGYYDRSVLAVTVLSLQKALTTIEELTARLTKAGL